MINGFGVLLGLSWTGVSYEILQWMLVVFGIGFLIFIHELGHFLLAKYEGVRVEAFALGFGPALLRKRVGGTDYRINFIPLGGYVKMAGELPGQGNTGASDEFTSKRPAQRARILVAGVTMNAIFGVIGVMLAVSIGLRFISPTVGLVQPGSPAWQAGLQKGDVIVAVNDAKVIKFTDLFSEVAFSDGEKVQLKVERNGQQFDCEVLPQYNVFRGLPTIGVAPFSMAEINVLPDSVEYKAGLRTGDVVTAINGNPVRDGYEASQILDGQLTEQIEITVARGTEQHQFKIPGTQQEVHRIGITTRQLQIGGIRSPGPLTTELTKEIHRAGLQVGDVITHVNGQAIGHGEMLQKALNEEAARKELTIDRSGKQRKIELSIASLEEFLQEISLAPELYIGRVFDDFPAAKFLKSGDKLVAINGQKLESWSDVVTIVQKSGTAPLEFTYLRGGETLTANIAPKKVILYGLGMGFYPKLTEPLEYGIVESFFFGWREAVGMVKQIFLSLKGIFANRVSAGNLGGPVLIFQASYSYLQMGMGNFIHFLAVISINLAVINLLPIPVLDGGHLFLLGIEKIKGKPLSEESLIWVNYLGLAFLLTLIIFVTWNDIGRLFG